MKYVTKYPRSARLVLGLVLALGINLGLSSVSSAAMCCMQCSCVQLCCESCGCASGPVGCATFWCGGGETWYFC